MDRKFSSDDPHYFFRKSISFATLADDTYLVSFTPTGASWDSGLITAKDFRGFGGFLQHFPDEDEVQAYYRELGTGQFRESGFLKAKTDIPPLSHLGFSYRSYWCGRDESPVLFNQRTGMAIPAKHSCDIKTKKRWLIKI